MPGGGAEPLTWDYDATGLGRGSDAEDLNFTHDDPDFNFDGSDQAVFHILYVGGCLNSNDTLHFSNNGSVHDVYSEGSLGNDDANNDYVFNADANTPGGDYFDGGLVPAGDSIPGGPTPDYGAEMSAGTIYDGLSGFVPNPAPGSGQCGFDVFRNVLLGARRAGGYPGAPVDIMGEIVVNSMSDTNLAATVGSPASSMGLDIVQTAVGAYDPLYGDFTLLNWEITNRDASPKGPIYIGTQHDWDINGGTNDGMFSDLFNGFAIYGGSPVTIAYGFLDPDQPHMYSSVDPSVNSPHQITILSNPLDVYTGGSFSWGNDEDRQQVWSYIAHGPSRDVRGSADDLSGLLVNSAINLLANETTNRAQAWFGVDGTGTPANIEANAAALAKRAARWGGWARGDVNDDGFVDLADVMWLDSGLPVYPADYSGDVNNSGGAPDAADEAQLLSYVSGNAGDQPVGAWRF
jgi:hypothetical protein